jgi:hypothetical protein
MKIEPADYEWRTVEAVVGNEVRVPYSRRATTILPTADDPDRVQVTYLAEDPDFDPRAELYEPGGETTALVNKIVVPRGGSVPLNHFHDEVTLCPSPEVGSLVVYFLGPIPFESEEVIAASGEVCTRRTECDPSR